MFKKIRTKMEISECQKKIKEIEEARYRSQAALVQAILEHKDPDDHDVDYFNNYTTQIEELRKRIKDLMKSLEA